MVGTCASRTTASIRLAPPRGITTSTRPRAWIRCVTVDRSAAESSWTASAGKSSLASDGAQHVDERLVGLRRRRTPAQQHGVTGLERQTESVDGDVGPALVDHADHAERNPLLAQLQAIGQGVAAQHLPDRVGQPRDLAQTGGDSVDAVRVQRQPVEHRGRCARGPGCLQIFGVGRQDLLGVGHDRLRRGLQRVVLGDGRQQRERAGGHAGAARGVVDLLAQVGTRWCLQTH